MKKIISIVTVIALVLSMTVVGFAAETFEADEPQTAEEWAIYYAGLINGGEEEASTIAEMIVANIVDGDIAPEEIGIFLKALANNVEVTAEAIETLTAVIEQVTESLGDLGIEIPDIGDVTLPDIGDITLPGGDDGDSDGSFIDTILGVLGTIGDLIFGGNDNDPDDSIGGGDDGDGDDSDLWGDGDDAFNDGSLGDTSVIAVATVAVVAGAALVLTRKKSDDAE